MQHTAFPSIIFWSSLFATWNGSFALIPRTTLDNTCANNDRDLDSLVGWASERSIQFSPAVSLATTNDEGDVGLVLNKSLKVSDSVLSVPRSIVFDSQDILLGWQLQLEEPIHYISSAGFDDSKLNFVLMVKVLYEYSLGGKSQWYPWLKSLPKTFQTGINMDAVERSCLPPFGIALAEYERKKFEMFSEALELINLESSFFNGMSLMDDTIAWAFNVVQTRCWTYEGDGENKRPIIVPLGDLLNHKEPANMIVEDKLNSDSIHFKLTEDMNLSSSSSTPELYLSYGLKNPYRFLIIFGFFDPTMPEIFCEVLFSNPPKEMIDLGCDDRSKMVYGTKDGSISDTVWDTVLYSLLDQVPEDQQDFYVSHLEGDDQVKAAIHDKYVMETSLALRKHVMKTLSELKNVLHETYTIVEASSENINEEHPRLAMIHDHNIFLYQTFDKVRQRIDVRAKEELKRRKHTSQ